jgi:hypothetical protein
VRACLPHYPSQSPYVPRGGMLKEEDGEEEAPTVLFSERNFWRFRGRRVMLIQSVKFDFHHIYPN